MNLIKIGMASFFSTPEYNVFDYRPRYFDSEKENRKERLRHLRIEKGKNPDIDSEEEVRPGSRIKGSFRARMSDRKYRKRSSAIRFLIILGFLFFIAYLILIADLTSVINYLS